LNLPVFSSLGSHFVDKIKLAPVELVEYKNADYVICGRLNNGKIEYALLIPEISANDSAFRSSLPVRTSWITADSESAQTTARTINDFALTLCKIKSWLTLENPSSINLFPYKLQFFQKQLPVTNGKLFADETYDLKMVPDTNLFASWDHKPQFCYIFGIDSKGNSTLIYPHGSNVENRLPLLKDKLLQRNNISILPIKIVPPYGYDTYILLTSQDAIPYPGALSFAGVNKDIDSGRGKGNSNALQELLNEIGTTTRGQVYSVPLSWSIQRVVMQSIP
jgi:hypothetical protein